MTCTITAYRSASFKLIATASAMIAPINQRGHLNLGQRGHYGFALSCPAAGVTKAAQAAIVTARSAGPYRRSDHVPIALVLGAAIPLSVFGQRGAAHRARHQLVFRGH